VRYLLLGGNQVNANALLRFYVLHCVVLPIAIVLLIAVHFWRIRKDGGLHVPEAQSGNEKTAAPGMADAAAEGAHD
jgi:quinol-cytochrome oxidoreductase complex cytochrome b subunit